MKRFCLCILMLVFLLVVTGCSQVPAEALGLMNKPYWIEYGLFDREPAGISSWSAVAGHEPYRMVSSMLSSKKVGDYVLLSNRFENAPAGSMVADEYIIIQIDPVNKTVAFALVKKHFLTYDAKSRIVCVETTSCDIAV